VGWLLFHKEDFCGPVQGQIRGTEHLVPCLNVLLGALEVPELELCVSSHASDVTVACLGVAASGHEADLLLALRKPVMSSVRARGLEQYRRPYSGHCFREGCPGLC